MFDIFGRFQRRQDTDQRCIDCGARTIYRRCDACARQQWRTTEEQRANPQPFTADEIAQLDGVDAAETVYLASLPTPPAVRDDEPFQASEEAEAVDTDGYPEMPAAITLAGRVFIPDEFAEQLIAVRYARESMPPIRQDWSGCCPWCAREMRELSDDTHTHRPRPAVVRTCPRHHAAALALNATIRSGGWRLLFLDWPQ